MAAHNYDGDMLTDEVAQVHRSPGFITSNLIGKNEDGSLIKGKYVIFLSYVFHFDTGVVVVALLMLLLCEAFFCEVSS